MTKKTPSIVLSLALVWASAAPAFAQGNVRVQTNGGAVNAVLPTLSIPSIGNLGAIPGSTSLPDVRVGVPSLPSLPSAIGSVSPAQIAAEAQKTARGAATPAAQFAKKGSGASQNGSGTPDRYEPDGSPEEQQGEIDGLGNPSRRGGEGGPDDRNEGGERQGGPSVFRALTNAIVSKLSGKVFDGSRAARGMAPSAMHGILPLPKPTLPQGVDLDEEPVSPDPRQAGNVEPTEFDSLTPGADTPFGATRVLTADANSDSDIERALRQMVDQDSAKFGVTSAELATVHVKRVAGVGSQADTVFALFTQQRQGQNPDGSPNRIAVHGTHASFTVKIINGKAVLMPQTEKPKLFSQLTVDTRQRLSDDELKAQAEARLGIPPNSGVELEFVERKIIFSNGAWHAANLYRIEGLPFMIAIDIATGEAFAWDARKGARYSTPTDAPPSVIQSAPQAAASGKFEGRVETKDARPNGQPQLSKEPLKFLKVTLADGRTLETDENGQIDVQIDKPTEATASLANKWVKVNDRANRPVQIKVTLQPGQKATVLINEQDNDEVARSQANVYVAVTHVNIWVRKRGIDDKRIDGQIPANVNINDECNAFFDYKSINFFKSSKNCSDTAKPGVVMHEWGHYLDHQIGGIVNGGLSEGWGDILSMYILNSPIIGEGFLKNRKPDYIRHGENDYQYGKWDEVHDQGQAWMGFAWKLRKALMVSLGEAAGAAAAESIVLPTLYAKASDIPSAMAQVLLNAMDKSGKLQYETEIRAAAKAHGIDLPKNPGFAASFWTLMTSPLRGLDGVGSELAALAAGGENGGQLLTSGGEGTQVPSVRGKVSMTVGRLLASRLEREIAKYCEFHDLKWDLKKFGGVLTVDMILTVEGPKDKVEHLIRELERIANS